MADAGFRVLKVVRAILASRGAPRIRMMLFEVTVSRAVDGGNFEHSLYSTAFSELEVGPRLPPFAVPQLHIASPTPIIRLIMHSIEKFGGTHTQTINTDEVHCS